MGVLLSVFLVFIPLFVIGPFLCEKGQNLNFWQIYEKKNNDEDEISPYYDDGAMDGATVGHIDNTTPPSLHLHCSCKPPKISVGGPDPCVKYQTYNFVL